MAEQFCHLLNTRQLAYFVAVAEHGSISAAAKAMGIAQPSMSENIAKLEKQLGLQLLLKNARGIQLTEAGKLLAWRSAEILSEIGVLVDEVQQLSEHPSGSALIGMTPSLGILLTVPLLETINAEYPDIRLGFSEGMSRDVVDWVLSERVEIGCVYNAHESAQLSVEPLLTEEIFLVTAPDNWDDEFGPNGMALNPIPAARLADLPLVTTSPSHGARRAQDKFAQSVGIKLDVVATIDSLSQIVEMVSRASAYTITSHGAVAKQVAEGKLGLVRIVDPSFIREASLVRKRSRPVSRASAIAEEYIKIIIREMIERYGMDSVKP